jgi:hypothetical protein
VAAYRTAIAARRRPATTIVRAAPLVPGAATVQAG